MFFKFVIQFKPILLAQAGQSYQKYTLFYYVMVNVIKKQLLRLFNVSFDRFEAVEHAFE